MNHKSSGFTFGPITFGLLAASFLFAGSLQSACGQAPASSPPASSLPDGHGKDLVLKDCQSCHSLQNVTSHRGNADDWAQVISQMIGRGANISDDDADTIVDYLSAHFGPASPKPAEPSSSPSQSQQASNTAAPSPDDSDKSGNSSSTVDVNKASADKLQSDLDLSKNEADDIVKYRQKNGDFKNMLQLLAVPGVDAKLKAEQDKISF